MHHTKFRENRPALSGEEDFLVVFEQNILRNQKFIIG